MSRHARPFVDTAPPFDADKEKGKGYAAGQGKACGCLYFWVPGPGLSLGCHRKRLGEGSRPFVRRSDRPETPFLVASLFADEP